MRLVDPSFATDPQTAAYYQQRADEYDEWYLGLGGFAGRTRPGWAAAVAQVISLLQSLPAARTLDVACGSGFLTRHLPGSVLGLDRSPAMVTQTRARLQHGTAVIGDALRLPLADHAVERVFTGHFYGHLPPPERNVFLTESARAGGELIVVDSARRSGVEPEQVQERMLNDGSRHRVFKRYLTAPQLAAEIGGEVLLANDWFVAARAERLRR